MSSLSLNSLLTPLFQWFAARTRSERRLLKICAILLTTISALTLLDWSAAERERVVRRLPVAKAEFERMQQNAAELEGLRRLPAAAAPSDAGISSAATVAARSHGLEISVESTPEGFLAKGSATLPPLVDWIATVHADLGIRPLRLKMTLDGNAEVEVLFAKPSGTQ